MADGPCPPVPEFGGTITNYANFGMKLVARVPAPHGWISTTVIRRRGSDVNPGPMYVGFQMEDAANNVIGPVASGSPQKLLNAGQSSTDTYSSIWTTPQKAAVRQVSLWSRPSGTGGQAGSTNYTYDVFMSLTFTGTCQDVIAALRARLATIVG